MLYFPSIFLFFHQAFIWYYSTYMLMYHLVLLITVSNAVHLKYTCTGFDTNIFFAEKLNHLSLYFLFVSINIIDDHISIKLLHNYPDPRQNVVTRSAESFKKVEDGIINPFPNFIGCPIEVWEWISNCILHHWVPDYLSMLRLELNHASKRALKLVQCLQLGISLYHIGKNASIVGLR